MISQTLIFALLYNYFYGSCISEKYEILTNGSTSDVMVKKLSNAVRVIGKNFICEEHLVATILPSKEESELLFEVMSKMVRQFSSNWNILIFSSYWDTTNKQQYSFYNKTPVLHNPDIYITYVKEHDDDTWFADQLRIMSQNEEFNPNSLFFLVKSTNECGLFRQANKSCIYFEALWKYNCLNACLLVLSKCDQQLTIVQATPFSKENPCRTPRESGIKYQLFTAEKKDTYLRVGSNDHQDFNGCQFTAGTIPTPPYTIAKEVKTNDTIHYDYVGGLEIELLQLLSKKLNFNYTFDTSHGFQTDAISKRLENGTTVGIAIDVINHKIDLAFGGVSPSIRNVFWYDFSTAYKLSTFALYVADANIAPQWKIIFNTFSYEVWIMTGLVYLLVTLSFIGIEQFRCNKMSKEIRSHNSKTRVVFEFFRVMLGSSSSIPPKDSSTLRTVFLSWVLYILILNVCYTSVLFKLLTHPPLEKGIFTLLDLKGSGLKVCSPDLYLGVFKNVAIDNVTRDVLDNRVKINDIDHCLKNLILFRNFSVMDRTEHFSYSVNPKISRVHKLEENLVTFGVCMVTNKGNPLSRGIKRLTLLMYESGLVQKWELEAWWKFNYKMYTEDRYTENRSLPLSIKNLQGPFLLLIVGVLFSSIAFFTEMVSFFLKHTFINNFTT